MISVFLSRWRRYFPGRGTVRDVAGNGSMDVMTSCMRACIRELEDEVEHYRRGSACEMSVVDAVLKRLHQVSQSHSTLKDANIEETLNYLSIATLLEIEKQAGVYIAQCTPCQSKEAAILHQAIGMVQRVVQAPPSCARDTLMQTQAAAVASEVARLMYIKVKHEDRIKNEYCCAALLPLVGTKVFEERLNKRPELVILQQHETLRNVAYYKWMSFGTTHLEEFELRAMAFLVSNVNTTGSNSFMQLIIDRLDTFVACSTNELGLRIKQHHTWRGSPRKDPT